jgi:hypothetical protein
VTVTCFVHSKMLWEAAILPVNKKWIKWCMHGLSLNQKYFFLRAYGSFWIARLIVLKTVELYRETMLLYILIVIVLFSKFILDTFWLNLACVDPVASFISTYIITSWQRNEQYAWLLRIYKSYSENNFWWTVNKTSNERKQISLYTRNECILKLLVNLVITRIEARVVSGSKFLYACVKEVCHLWAQP